MGYSHIVANQISIPLEQLEGILLERATPGFTGTVRVTLRVLPIAAFAVEFEAETKRFLSIDHDKSKPAGNRPRTDVREVIREHAGEFTIGTKVSEVQASFVNGEIRSFQITQVEKCQPQPTGKFPPQTVTPTERKQA